MRQADVRSCDRERQPSTLTGHSLSDLLRTSMGLWTLLNARRLSRDVEHERQRMTFSQVPQGERAKVTPSHRPGPARCSPAHCIGSVADGPRCESFHQAGR